MLEKINRPQFLAISLIFILLSGHTRADSPVSLDQKLTQYFNLYQKARQEVLTKLEHHQKAGETSSISNITIDREAWEKSLLPATDFQLTAKDKILLKNRHLETIQKAHAKAKQEYPKLSLASLRKLAPKMQKERGESFCSAFPKGGMLHAHILGTVNRSTARTILEGISDPISVKELTSEGLSKQEIAVLKEIAHSPAKAFRSLSKSEQERFLDFYELSKPFPKSFKRFQSVFNFIQFLEKNPQALPIALEDLANRAQQQNLVYLELDNWVDTTDRKLVKQYEDIFQSLEKKYGVVMRLNVSFFRALPVDLLYKQAQQFVLQDRSPYITGIDLVQNEELPHVTALEKGIPTYGSLLLDHQKGHSAYHRTMHAGELGDTRNPRDAMILGAERLGHGVKLQEDEVALEYAAKNHIPVEINLTSNYQLGVSNIESHPYLSFLRLGLPVSLSTDDEGIFHTSIINECVQAILKTSIEYTELKAMSFNSIETAFVEDKVKSQLLERLTAQFSTFEKSATSYFQ